MRLFGHSIAGCLLALGRKTNNKGVAHGLNTSYHRNACDLAIILGAFGVTSGCTCAVVSYAKATPEFYTLGGDSMTRLAIAALATPRYDLIHRAG